MYSKIVGLLFYVTGPVRHFAQYTNVLLGLSVVLIVKRVMDQMPLSEARYRQVLALVALLPNSLILTAVFLREASIAFLVSVSAYYFFRWFRGGAAWTLLPVGAAVLAASTLHAGVVVVGLGYIMVVLAYNRNTGRVGLRIGSLVYLVGFVALVYLTLGLYPDLFLGKFEDFETESDLLTAANRRDGAAQYLSGLTVESYTDMIRHGPLRALYFLGSPMPWLVRGVVDALTFVLDSLFYLGMPIFFLLRRRALDKRDRLLGYALMLVIVVSSLVFGSGVSNAGTAVRHRFKLSGVFMVLAAVASSRSARADSASRPTIEVHRA